MCIYAYIDIYAYTGKMPIGINDMPIIINAHIIIYAYIGIICPYGHKCLYAHECLYINDYNRHLCLYGHLLYKHIIYAYKHFAYNIRINVYLGMNA